jgi:excisionase family DNA binding protein
VTDARPLPELLTADEAARALRVSRATLLRRQGDEGFPRAFKVGHNWRFRADDLRDVAGRENR